jgi:hypothetical protein
MAVDVVVLQHVQHDVGFNVIVERAQGHIVHNAKIRPHPRPLSSKAGERSAQSTTAFYWMQSFMHQYFSYLYKLFQKPMWQ